MRTRRYAVITGSHGFLASHLLPYLESKGLGTIRLKREELYNPIALGETLTRANPVYIFHLASYGNMSQQRSENDIFMANLVALWNLLQASKTTYYKAFINISTSAVILPHQTFYSATKIGGEYLCRAFATEYKRNIFSVRPYSLYGEREQQDHLIPTVFRSCLTQERMDLVPWPVHDWVYVGDFVKALYELATSDSLSPGASFGIGTGVSTTNEEVVRLIEKVTGKIALVHKKHTLRSYDSRYWQAGSNELLSQATSLESGLRLYYDWVRKEKII